MKLISIIVLLLVAIAIAGCGNKDKPVDVPKADVSASLEKATIKDGTTTGLTMTAKNKGTETIVGTFEVAAEDPSLVTVSYDSRKDFTLAAGESITKRYAIEGHTKIRASEVMLTINLTAPGVGGYVSLGNAKVALRIEK
jgi:predicted small lipoprotein YifL